MSDWTGTYQGSLPSSDIDKIRLIINLRDGAEGGTVELSDGSIEIAIVNAHTFISTLASRSGASSELIALAKINYAAYLAYQTYADRIVEEIPGAFDAQGVLQPIASPLARQVADKLRGLKETADKYITLLTYCFQEVDTSSVVPMNDAADYPDQMKMSTLKSCW